MGLLSPRKLRQNITIDEDLWALVMQEKGRTGVSMSAIISGRLRASYEQDEAGVSGIVGQMQMDVEEVLRLLRPVVAWMRQMGVVEGETVMPAQKAPPKAQVRGQDYYAAQLEAEGKTPTPPVVTAPQKRGWFGR